MERQTKSAGQLLDLIYLEARKERIEDVRNLLYSSQCVLPQKIHRVTMFLTFRCNLRCQYCNTIRHAGDKPWPARDKEYDFELFKRVVNEISPSRILHMHLTGGEATLVKDLPRMVEYLSNKGIPCSLTTNGTADEKLYGKLVRRGLQEIRISCDTHVPQEFERLVGKKRAYDKVIRAIQKLVGMRDAGWNIYIILNCCVGSWNMKHVPSVIKHSIALRPDDMKLIGISHERDGLAAFEQRQEIIEEVREYLEQFPEKSFPLLRMKLKTIFSQDTYGLEDITSKKLMKNCFIPFTERVLDTQYYYPCPTYVREGGKPLRSLDEDYFTAQQKKTRAFVNGDSCTDDPICRQFCINCCKKFNLHANALINYYSRMPDGSREIHTEYKGEITNEDIVARMKDIANERRTFSNNIPYKPFLVIKPSGMFYVKTILSYLQSHDITIEKNFEIPDWNEVAMRLYSNPLTEDRVFRGILMARALPEIESTTKAEVLVLKGDYTFERLDRLKKNIRSTLPPLQCLIFYREEIVLTSLSYLHSPSEKNYHIEANILFPTISSLRYA